MCEYNHGPRARRSWQISLSIKQSLSSYHWLEVYYRLILYELHFYLQDGVTKLSYCKNPHIHTVPRLQQNRHRERELSHCELYMSAIRPCTLFQLSWQRRLLFATYVLRRVGNRQLSRHRLEPALGMLQTQHGARPPQLLPAHRPIVKRWGGARGVLRVAIRLLFLRYQVR